MLRIEPSKAIGSGRPVPNQGDRHNMVNLRRRGRRVAVGSALAGAVAAAMALSAPAGASTTNAANHVILGSGSSTSYTTMQALDTLFNDSLGCYMTQPSGTNQTLNFSCASNNQGDQVGEGYTENPVNDVAAEEPALGSSAGIDQIEFGGTGNDGGGTAEPTAVVNFARSSRAYKTSDYPGLNFVAYATDGVSWFTFPTVGGTATASSGVTNLTTTQLTDIWNGSINNWDEIGGADASICVYTAQLSSGTESTWATALGFSSPTTLNAYVNSNPSLSGCDIPAGQTYGSSHTIFENEGQDIVKNGDEAQAIYFFSYGKYQTECNIAKPTNPRNNGIGATSKPVLGEINGVKATAKSILCDVKSCTTQFPVIRDLYNVYSNGSFSPSVNATYGFPAATAATINYVSEVGFLCKGQLDTTKAEVDNPTTGDWYHTDIANTIKAQGFIAFPLQKAEDINTVDTPASAVLTADGDTTYSPDDPITGSTTAANEAISDPTGYCQVWTTDGNTAP
jgi:ABC-type phosphate transport system substrate-binding protein